jgi:proteasome accessory factor B
MLKGMSRPPLQRMQRIHEALLRNSYPNCQNLSADLEVSYKTIQRDVDFMRDRLALPIAFDREHNGFRYTQHVENFPLVQVTEGELVALFVAEKALAQYHGTPFEKPLQAAFKKLTDRLGDRVSFPWNTADPSISFRTTGTTVTDLEVFEEVSHAVLRAEELTFEYRSLRNARPEPRRVQPYHLGCIENQWYLFAFDLDRQQMRTFVLSRMSHPRITGHRFRRPAGFSLAAHLRDSFGVFRGNKPQKIRLRFDAWAAQLIRDRQWHPSQQIKELPAGELELTFRLTSLVEIHRWILSWGEHARVLAPVILQKRLRLTAQMMMEHYS